MVALLLSGLLLLLAPFTLAFSPSGLVSSDSDLAPIDARQLALLGESTPPEIEAAAYLIMDSASGKVVFEKNARERRAPASLTKIMTAIVVLENADLSDKVAVEEQYLVGEAAMGLAAGDVLTVEDLLWGLLLPSGNDAANVLAAYLGRGSSERFVQMMNEKAADLNLRGTAFKNPHGLDEEGHYTSAYDLALMGRYAMRNPTFRRMVGTNIYTVHASRDFWLMNSNQLLRRQELVPGVDGIKTGTTEKAGDSIVASATRNGRQIIAVVLGAENRVPQGIALVNYAFSAFEWVRPPFPAFLYPAEGASAPEAGPREEMLPLWAEPYISVAVRPAAGAGARGGSELIYRLKERFLSNLALEDGG